MKTNNLYPYLMRQSIKAMKTLTINQLVQKGASTPENANVSQDHAQP